MITEKIESINRIAIEIYKKAIHENNISLEDNALQIIKDINLISELYVEPKKSTLFENNKNNEIKKVKRKVPLWMKRQHQYNYIILSTYMKISNSDEVSILLTQLEKKSELDSVLFYRHYNLMKNIFEKNHAKVFTEEDGEVCLWKPISEFIIEVFSDV
jgi:hypothetical protein